MLINNNELEESEDQLLEELEDVDMWIQHVIKTSKHHHHPVGLSGESGLWMSVLMQAFNDCIKGRNAKIKRDASSWLFNNRDRTVGSVLWVAETLSIEPVLLTIRDRIKNNQIPKRFTFKI